MFFLVSFLMRHTVYNVWFALRVRIKRETLSIPAIDHTKGYNLFIHHLFFFFFSWPNFLWSRLWLIKMIFYQFGHTHIIINRVLSHLLCTCCDFNMRHHFYNYSLFKLNVYCSTEGAHYRLLSAAIDLALAENFSRIIIREKFSVQFHLHFIIEIVLQV